MSTLKLGRGQRRNRRARIVREHTAWRRARVRVLSSVLVNIGALVFGAFLEGLANELDSIPIDEPPEVSP